ncbi:MAG TPA: hypothetical protein VFU76_03120 [Terriglobales bacterium]|nr:hypothetical protein [Terriglobales bacterium]
MKKQIAATIGLAAMLLALVLVPAAGAQDANFLIAAEGAPVLSWSRPASSAALPAPAIVEPSLSPEAALEVFQKRAARQSADLGAYTDWTTVEADLPATSQHGQFRLRRSFAAPNSLAFDAIKFVGDGFVKTNVITRLLQSEAQSVKKGEGAGTAMNADNYKFSYKGVDDLWGQQVYVYQLKPREKRLGLFKGKIYLDMHSGRIRRAEGEMVKSPSFFVKKIRFTQDYAEFGDYSFPVHIHSQADTRIIGQAIVDIYHGDYRARSVAEVHAEGPDGGRSTSTGDDNRQ